MGDGVNKPRSVILTRVNFWLKDYCTGRQDGEALRDFVTCETDEVIRSLQAELVAISNGKVPQNELEKILGKGRLLKHGSFQAWSQMMVRLIAEFKRN